MTKKSFGSYFKKRQKASRVEESLQSAVEKEMQSYLMIPEIDSDRSIKLVENSRGKFP